MPKESNTKVDPDNRKTSDPDYANASQPILIREIPLTEKEKNAEAEKKKVNLGN